MDHLGVADVLGFAAATLTTAAFVPQAVKSWRTRRADDLSLAMFLMFCIGIALWLVYGILLDQWPIIAANIVTLGLAGSILYVKVCTMMARTGTPRAS